MTQALIDITVEDCVKNGNETEIGSLVFAVVVTTFLKILCHCQQIIVKCKRCRIKLPASLVQWISEKAKLHTDASVYRGYKFTCQS